MFRQIDGVHTLRLGVRRVCLGESAPLAVELIVAVSWSIEATLSSQQRPSDTPRGRSCKRGRDGRLGRSCSRIHLLVGAPQRKARGQGLLEQLAVTSLVCLNSVLGISLSLQRKQISYHGNLNIKHPS